MSTRYALHTAMLAGVALIFAEFSPCLTRVVWPTSVYGLLHFHFCLLVGWGCLISLRCWAHRGDYWNETKRNALQLFAMSKRKAPDDDDKEGLPPAPLPPFEDLRAHLEKVQEDEKLVDLLGEAWDSDDVRRYILSILGGWASVSDDNEFRKHDWDIQDDEYGSDDEESGLKLYFASNNVRLTGYNRAKNVDPKDCSHGCYINYNGGCQECSGDEVYCFNMEKRRTGLPDSRFNITLRADAGACGGTIRTTVKRGTTSRSLESSRQGDGSAV